MTLDEKIAKANDVVSKILPHYHKPIVMSSFGKDSMVLLDLLARLDLKFPVLFHREPFFPEKNRFANRVIEKMGYITYDYPPSGTGVAMDNKGEIESIANWYSIGKKYGYRPTGVREPTDYSKPFLCGYKDFYERPTIDKFNFLWDLVFVGHKNSDSDPLFGEIPLKVDLKLNVGGPDFLFPLRYFTDADIWAYHVRFGVPMNIQRYGRDGSRDDKADLTFNNDYYPTCTRCMNPNNPDSVHCPKLGQEIPNISSELVFINTKERPAYLGGGNEKVN